MTLEELIHHLERMSAEFGGETVTLGYDSAQNETAIVLRIDGRTAAIPGAWFPSADQVEI